jgi:uncharacterized protein (TIGR00661 family)
LIDRNKFNSNSKRTRILVAPLDWGLGHASRCIPIINELILLDCEVYIAAYGMGFLLLKKEFPKAVFLRIDGYKIEYSKHKWWLPFKLSSQLPKVIYSIWKENRWLKKNIVKYKFNTVISDNRFGLYSNKIPCFFITHQLLIKTGNFFTEKILQSLNYFFIKKFSGCWVPDWEKNGLAGGLSHPAKIPLNAVFIGPLSRFQIFPAVPKKFEILITLSGPEPQRTIFERIILSQIKDRREKILLVRGLPGNDKALTSISQLVTIVNHLSATELNQAFLQSEIIISRSGYSTVMDLIKLQKQAILVATPGQTEQEYLSKYLAEKNYFFACDQATFSLDTAIKNAASFPFIKLSNAMDDYKKVLSEFVLSLKSGKFANQ